VKQIAGTHVIRETLEKFDKESLAGAAGANGAPYEYICALIRSCIQSIARKIGEIQIDLDYQDLGMAQEISPCYWTLSWTTCTTRSGSSQCPHRSRIEPGTTRTASSARYDQVLSGSLECRPYYRIDDQRPHVIRNELGGNRGIETIR